MNIKLETILNTKEALEILSQKDLSIKTSFKIAKLIKAANKELETYNEQRIKLLESIGSTLNAESGQYEIPSDKRREFAEKFNELISIEVDMPDKIDMSNENISISPDLLIALESFIDFEE